jgi:ubiquinone/menaquinone biosynthesis C-methylase UbiE
MVTSAESEQGRRKRRYQRTLFDGVAELYEDSRLGYPGNIVDFMLVTAEVGAGSDVLEVGCGTGQLTAGLVNCGFRLTAIDIGASMVAVAQRRLNGSDVSFQVASFEDFAAADASLDLIVSATAFHWIDPEVNPRSARAPACSRRPFTRRTRGGSPGRPTLSSAWRTPERRP